MLRDREKLPRASLAQYLKLHRNGAEVNEVSAMGVWRMDGESQQMALGVRGATALGSGTAVMGIPAVSWASQFGGAPSVAAYTAVGLLVVMVAAITAVVALEGAYRFHLLDAERRARLRRHLRVVFGAALLLALVTPYVALNFSPEALIPFVFAAGVVVAAWAWAATGGDSVTRQVGG